MHVGGHAEWLLEPADPGELSLAWGEARARGMTRRLLGGGANLLIEDGELPGVVVSTARMRRSFRPLPPGAVAEEDGPSDFGEQVPRIAPLERGEDPRLVAWAGATLPGLVRTAQELGWSGLEGLVGVPGSLGGGIAMNAGGAPGVMWDVVETVRVLTEGGELEDRPRAECTPGYRDGGLGDAVVVGAVLRLTVDSKAAVQERTRDFLVRKKAVQPVTEWSSGCIFRNPDPERSDGRGAGQLIDDCGGKGLARGDAIVSPVHANFIVNRGQASAEDVFGLIENVRELVERESGVRLVTEVRVWRSAP